MGVRVGLGVGPVPVTVNVALAMVVELLPCIFGLPVAQLGMVTVTLPLPFEPGPGAFDWTQSADRERAARESERRITESFETTIALQTDDQLSNVKLGFFLVYLTSFNEWHEGHEFEPMKDADALSPDERRREYHNPSDGAYRLTALRRLLTSVIDPR